MTISFEIYQIPYHHNALFSIHVENKKIRSDHHTNVDLLTTQHILLKVSNVSQKLIFGFVNCRETDPCL